MAKKTIKVKEPIRLREKVLNNGNRSLYLDIYRNGQRKYEFLKMYLIPESDSTAKERNKQTLLAANAIKAQRIIELTNNEAGIVTKGRGIVPLADWMDECVRRAERNGCSPCTLSLKREFAKKVIEFQSDVRLCDIDKEFCINFINFLRTARKHNGEKYSAKTIFVYTAELKAVLNEAVREDLIVKNPMSLLSSVEKPREPSSTREFLTAEELERLKATPCKYKEVKDAFLFSCYSGLRLSDVENLRWSNLEKTDNGKIQVALIQGKTKQPNRIQLPTYALSCLPAYRKGNELIFNLPSRPVLTRAIKNWAENAGITKNVSFHIARHTFATSLLTMGADLYTTSKLLGHTKITTTQIYAKIVDAKKEEAMSLFDKAAPQNFDTDKFISDIFSDGQSDKLNN